MKWVWWENLYNWCPNSVPHLLPAKNYKFCFKFAKIIVKKLLAFFVDAV